MKRAFKITSIFIASVIVLATVALLLIKIYSPSYIIPYVIKKVEKETNGRYTLSINSDSLKIDFISMTARLGATKFQRDSTVMAYSNIPFLDKFDVDATFESFNIKALNLVRFLVSKRLVVDEISLIRPSVIIKKNSNYDPEKEQDAKKNNSGIHLHFNDTIFADTLSWQEFQTSGKMILPHLKVESFKITDANFQFFGDKVAYPIHEVNGLTFEVSGFHLLREKDFDIEELTVSVDSVSSLLDNNIARLQIQGLKLHPESFHIDSVHFNHIVSKDAINKIKGYRAAWLDIGVKNIDVEGLNPAMLISDSTLMINRASIGDFSLYLYKDKNEPLINPAYKPLPQESLRGLSAGLKIDTIEIVNAFMNIEMKAPHAEKPGNITMNQTSGLITNVTNIPKFLDKNPYILANLSTKIMNQIPVTLDYKLNVASAEDQHWASCKAAPFEASILNEFLGSQFLIEFKSGYIDNLEFEYEGNNKVNVGEMDFEFRNLKVQKAAGYDNYIEGKPKTGFISAVGNFLIPNNRSESDKNYKRASIYHEKQFNRPLIFGTIMSMLSGILSSTGLKTKNIEKDQKKADALTSSDDNKAEEAVIKETEKIEKEKERTEEKENKKEKKKEKKEHLIDT